MATQKYNKSEIMKDAWRLFRLYRKFSWNQIVAPVFASGNHEIQFSYICFQIVCKINKL